jgi:phosphoglycolate phosphatase
MSGPLRFAIFDVDGTLVDSQGAIVAAMTAAFDTVGLQVPDRGAILGIVGLSLGHAMLRLVPDATDKQRDALEEAYRAAYFEHRAREGAARSAPLYPGALEVLERLGRVPDLLLGIATGKSRRGLNALLAGHGMERMFVTTQVADDHPSKPHPSMIETALRETGVLAENAVMIGDTRFDMDMARAAGVTGIGVSWGYHPGALLGAGAMKVIHEFSDLPGALADRWSVPI